jgi:O-antigen/teichoic acid export membrane protein
MRDYARADIIRASITLALIYSVLAITHSPLALTAMLGAGYVVATLVLVTIVPIDRRLPRPSWRAFSWPTFLASARVHPTNLLGLAVFRLDIVVMALISSKAEVAFYSLATVFAEGVWLVPAAIGVIGFSDVARISRYETRRLTLLGLKRALIFGTATALAIGGLATLAVPLLLSKAYEHAITPLWISLAGAVAYSVCHATAPFILIGLGRRLVITLITAATLAINIGLLLVLGPRYGAIGASTASSIAYGIAGLLVLGFFAALDR